MLKCQIIKTIKLEFNWHKVYYESDEDIEFQGYDKIKIIYAEKESYTATIIEIDEDENGKFIVLSPRYRDDIHPGNCELQLIFSPRKSIKESYKVISVYEYWPSFHDDEIEEVKLDSSGISMIIKMNTVPDSKEKYKVVLKFFGIKQMEFQDWWSSNIVLGIEFSYNGDFIQATIDASLGLVGSIVCEKVSVDFIE